MKPRRGKKKEPISQSRWAVSVFLIAVTLSALLSLGSQSILNGTGLTAALLIMVLFIGLGILFDIIGVAVTAADAKPFHAMASHKEKGAKECLMLLRNADRVSSVCNDVVGDICGIVSGTTAAVIVIHLQRTLNTRNILLSVFVTALLSGLTIGGKALGKTLAIRKNKQVVYLAGRVLYILRGGARRKQH